MTVIITTQANREHAESLGIIGAQYVSPTQKRAVHGAEKVVIIGIYPRVERMYQGICPVEVVHTKDKPKSEIVEPDES